MDSQHWSAVFSLRRCCCGSVDVALSLCICGDAENSGVENVWVETRDKTAGVESEGVEKLAPG